MNEKTNGITATNPLAAIETQVAKADDVISALVTDLLNKHNEVKAGPVSILLTLQDDDVYGDDLSAVFPRPVAKKTDEAGLGDNALKEYFKAAKPDKNGDFKERNCNYFTEWWKDTATGKAQTYVLNQLAHFGKGGDPLKAEKKYQDMPGESRENLRKKTESNMSRARSWVREAVGIFFVMQDLENHSERVTLEFDLDPNNKAELSSSQYPFNLLDQKRSRNLRPMTVSDVLKLDVETALQDAGEKGSLYDALLRQLKRGKKDGKTEAANFGSVDDAFKAMRQFNNWLDDSDHSTLLQTLFAKKGSDELIFAWGTFVGSVKATWNPALETRFRRIVEKQIAEGALDEKKSEAEAKAA